MSTFIDQTLDEYNQLTDQWLAFIDSCDATLLNTKPTPDAWSALECLKHVSITGNQYVRHLDPIVEQARTNGPKGVAEYKPGFMGKFILSQTNPPYKIGVKTFPMLDPKEQQYNPAELRDEFVASKEALARIIENLEGIAIGKKWCQSVVTPALWMPLGLWFRFIAAHERRHLWQAERTIERVRNHAGSSEE